MSKNGNDWAQLFHFWVEVVQWRPIDILILTFIQPFCQKTTVPAWKKSIYYLLLQNQCAVIPIFRISLHKGPSVDIAHIRPAIGPQKVESTDFLLKFLNNFITDELLIWSKDDWISDLFSFFVPLNHTVESWRPSSLGIHIVWTNCVDLDIEGISWKELFVYIVSIFPDLVQILILAWLILDLSKELLSPPAHRLGIVHTDFVVFRVERLLDKRFL